MFRNKLLCCVKDPTLIPVQDCQTIKGHKCLGGFLRLVILVIFFAISLLPLLLLKKGINIWLAFFAVYFFPYVIFTIHNDLIDE